MRIVHLSTHDLVGGAARAAFRLHKCLLAAGEDSSMLVNSKTSALDSVRQAARPRDIHSHLGYLAQIHYLDANRSALSNTGFSLGWPGHDLSGYPLVRQADILHLHWVSSYQSASSLAALCALGKPVVWTLHDQRAFTGGCHYSAGCTKYETGCAGCPQLAADPFRLPAANLADQAELLPRTGITVIAPSQWMADCARRSVVFRGARTELIPNSLETDLFQPRARDQARGELGWPPKALCLLFGADYGNERRKGFRELMASLKLCMADADFAQEVQARRVQLFCFGHPSPELKDAPVPVQNLGHISSNEAMARVYAAANLFLLPSIEDNLPNTLLESMSCGTPVAAFRTGGVPDLVVEGVTGHLAPTGDVREFSRILLSAASNPKQLEEMGRSCRRQAEDNFTPSRQAQQCRDLYRDLLQERPPSACASSYSADANVGPQFRRVFPQILSALFARNIEVVPPPRKPAAVLKYEIRRARFMQQAKRALAETAAGRLAYPELMSRLGAELTLLEGKNPWRMKLKRFLKGAVRLRRAGQMAGPSY